MLHLLRAQGPLVVVLPPGQPLLLVPIPLEHHPCLQHHRCQQQLLLLRLSPPIPSPPGAPLLPQAPLL
jgi:hypothetical protein